MDDMSGDIANNRESIKTSAKWYENVKGWIGTATSHLGTLVDSRFKEAEKRLDNLENKSPGTAVVGVGRETANRIQCIELKLPLYDEQLQLQRQLALEQKKWASKWVLSFIDA